jgi:pyrroline-5-carboxylate reductase
LETLIIIGNGNMARAIVSGIVDKYKITVIGRDSEKLQNLQKELNGKIEIGKFPVSVEGENVLLAIKPHSIDELSQKITGNANILMSVLAGVEIAKLKERFEAKNYIRAMPNLSALFGESMTSLTGDENGKYLATKIFLEVGSVVWFESENEIDIATAIAGSGPAYLALVAEALADGGVKAGLKRTDSEKLVKGLFRGFSPLIASHKASDIKDGVMSPKGTTAYGYGALEENGVRSAFIKAVEEAYNRAIELR